MSFIKPAEIYIYLSEKYRGWSGIGDYMVPIFGDIYFGRIKSIIKKIYQINKRKLYSPVLDVGGGFGLFCANIKRNFPESDVYLSEILSNEIMAIIKNIMKNKLHIDLNYKFKCDIQKKTSFESNKFEMIFILDVFEHLEYPNLALDEIIRILKKKGILIISVPTESKLIKLFRSIYSNFGIVDLNPHWNGPIKSEKDFFKFLKKKEITIIMKKKYPFNFLPKFFSYDMFYFVQKI